MPSSKPPREDRKTPVARATDLAPVFVLLTIAGFAVSLNIRLTDPLLPPLAAEFNSTPGKVAIVSIFYAVAHGFM